MLQCVKDTGVDTGIDINDVIAFVKRPGSTNTSFIHQETHGDLIQTTLEEFVVACRDKSLSQVSH